MKLLPIIALVFFALIGNTKINAPISVEQDTTTIEYWKKKAREAEALARAAMMDAMHQQRLANKNMEVAVKQEKQCQQSMERLNALVVQKQKEIDELKGKR